MIGHIGCLPVLFFSAGAFAGTVIYTDSTRPVLSPSPNIPVVYLDAPDHLQAEVFGFLPTDVAQAEKVNGRGTRLAIQYLSRCPLNGFGNMGNR